MYNNKINDLKPLEGIVEWRENGDDSVLARVLYTDGTEETLLCSPEEWDQLKQRELEAGIRKAEGQLIRVGRVEMRLGLCAWCQSVTLNGYALRKLSPDEFEATRHNGSSHGICHSCKKNEVAKAKAASEARRAAENKETTTEDKAALARVARFLRSRLGLISSLVLISVVVSVLSGCSNPVSSRNDRDDVQERKHSTVDTTINKGSM